MREFKSYIRVFYTFAEYLIIDKIKALINYKKNNYGLIWILVVHL